MFRITFTHTDKIIDAADGDNLMKLCHDGGVVLMSPCGGGGICGKCGVRILDNPPRPTKSDEKYFNASMLASGWRLACRVEVYHDMTVEVPALAGGEVILCESGEGDAVLRKISPDIDVGLGLAVDLGTTTIAGALFDLSTGKKLASCVKLNPQARYGADVIARIEHSNAGEKQLVELQRLAIGAINEILAGTLERTSMQREDVRKIFVGGNTTMQHLLLGVSPSGIAVSPFTPQFTDAKVVSAMEVGLNVPAGCRLNVLPAVSGYIGGDIVADILAAGWVDSRDSRTVVLVDVGTNGEIALKLGEKIITCSTAAGPAFEGAKITFGMRAASGAISRIDFDEGDLAITTIDDAPAVGICGTGLLDAAAVLLDAGVIDETGMMISPDAEAAAKVPPLVRERLTDHNGMAAIRLAGDVLLTAKDVREFQLAKAAVSAGVKVLMDINGVKPADVSRVLLAGAMGSFLRPDSAIRTGLLPRGFSADHVLAVGNTALVGVSMCMLSKAQRDAADRLSGEIAQYVELSGRMDFMEAYTDAMYF